MGEILLSGSAKSSFTPLLRGYTGGKQDRVAGEIEALVKCLFSKNRKKTPGLQVSRDDKKLSCLVS